MKVQVKDTVDTCDAKWLSIEYWNIYEKYLLVLSQFLKK